MKYIILSSKDRDPANFGLVEKWRKIERPLSATTKVLFQSKNIIYRNLQELVSGLTIVAVLDLKVKF